MFPCLFWIYTATFESYYFLFSQTGDQIVTPPTPFFLCYTATLYVTKNYNSVFFPYSIWASPNLKSSKNSYLPELYLFLPLDFLQWFLLQKFYVSVVFFLTAWGTVRMCYLIFQFLWSTLMIIFFCDISTFQSDIMFVMLHILQILFCKFVTQDMIFPSLLV